MFASIQITQFEIDTSSAAEFSACDNKGRIIMTAKFDFADDTGDCPGMHKITHAVLAEGGLSHYAQTQILFEFSKMLDSHFAPDSEPYSALTIEV